ncbi:MAG: hypothetical protein GY745_24130 [Actinomycetia bacterium]|nr:hypothetical protein [Actinomycetes bacterium]MCP4088104.1 hypothetical protein [Actinomycetes bacterium]
MTTTDTPNRAGESAPEVSGGLVMATSAWSATKPGLDTFTSSLAAMGPPHHKEQDS